MSDISERHEPELIQRRILEKLLAETALTPFEQFRNFPVFTPRFNLARFLSHYEIFKQIVELPGVIIDIGVYRGASSFTFAKFCEIFCPTDVKKVVYGFDTFKGFPLIGPEDGQENPAQDVRPGGYHGGDSIQSELEIARQAMNADRHLKHLQRLEFVVGDICETVPRFVREKGNGLRVALLNLDADLYKPTLATLENIVPRMVRGGIVICDEYAVDTFGGESKAVDDYFLKTVGCKPEIRKFPWHSNPSGYIVVH